MARQDPILPRDTEAEEAVLAILLHVSRPCKAWRHRVSPTLICEQLTADDFFDPILQWLFVELERDRDWLARWRELSRECRQRFHVDLYGMLEDIGRRHGPAEQWHACGWFIARLREARQKRERYDQACRELEQINRERT